jgi:hypothetical protein
MIRDHHDEIFTVHNGWVGRLTDMWHYRLIVNEKVQLRDGGSSFLDQVVHLEPSPLALSTRRVQRDGGKGIPGQCASGLGEIVQVREGVGGKASWSLHVLLSLPHPLVLIIIVLSQLQELLLLGVLRYRDPMVSYIRVGIPRCHGNRRKVRMTSSVVHVAPISGVGIVCSSNRVERTILHRHDSVI